MCLSFPPFRRKPNGDYRSSPVAKDRSRSPIERVVVPSALGVHSNHLYSHAHHHHHHLASLAGMDQPLALTKNSMVESARSSTAAMATVPHTVSAVERQQVTCTSCFFGSSTDYIFHKLLGKTSTLVGPPHDVTNVLSLARLLGRWRVEISYLACC